MTMNTKPLSMLPTAERGKKKDIKILCVNTVRLREILCVQCGIGSRLGADILVVE